MDKSYHEVDIIYQIKISHHRFILGENLHLLMKTKQKVK